ncbi:uncharacterized protein LOC104266103 [Ciona intestinalis]
MLIAVTAIEFILGVAAISSRYSQMEYKIYNNVVVDIVSLTKENHFHYVRTQQILECCGATRGCQDWSTMSSSYGCGCVPTSMSNGASTDPDCVLAHSVDCGPDTATSSVYVYKKPCSKPIIKVVSKLLDYVAGSSFTAAVFHVRIARL